MRELIDKAKLIEYLAAIKPDEYVSAYGEAAVDVINHVGTYVSEMPTIEPEVRHGRWIELPKALNPEETPCKCSACGHILSFYGCYRKSNFCPQCGARMDGGADNG